MDQERHLPSVDDLDALLRGFIEQTHPLTHFDADAILAAFQESEVFRGMVAIICAGAVQHGMPADPTQLFCQFSAMAFTWGMQWQSDLAKSMSEASEQE